MQNGSVLELGLEGTLEVYRNLEHSNAAAPGVGETRSHSYSHSREGVKCCDVCVVFNVKPYGQNRRMPGDEGILGWGLIT